MSETTTSPATPATEAPAQPDPRLVLVVVMVGTFLSVLDSVILNIALPYIMSAFSSDVEQAKWITAGFMIAAAVSMPLTGWLGERFSYGLLFTTALTVFSAGAVLGAVAWSLEVLIAARIVQGIGAGVVQPASIAILTHAFPPHQRGRAFGVWVIGWMTAPTVGPVLSGLIIEYFSWRTIFTLSAFVGVAAVPLSAAVLSRERVENPPPFDWWGYGALTVMLVSAFLWITYGQQEGWTSEIIVLGMVVTATAFAVLLVVEWGLPHAIVPLRLFRVPDFSLAAFITIYRALGLFGPVFLLPIFLVQIQDRESISIGLLLMPAAVVMALGSPLAGALTDRFGGKGLTIVGIFSLAFALYLFSHLDWITGKWAVVLPQLFQGLGVAFVMTPLVTIGMNAVPHRDAGTASWILNLCQRGGGAFAITILGTLLDRETQMLKEHLGTAALIADPPTQVMTDLARVLGWGSPERLSATTAAHLRQVGEAAGTMAFENLFIFAAGVTLTAVLPALLLSRGRAAPPRK